MDSAHTSSATRAAAISALAVVGFVALIGSSIWLAAYSTRYVPGIVTRVGSAAVYLGSFFHPSSTTLSVVPTPVEPTTLPFPTSTTTQPFATTTRVVLAPVSTPRAVTHSVPTTPGPQTSTVYQIGGTSSSPSLYGYPDLVTSIVGVGYLATSSADSFVSASTVTSGSRPAVKFTIKNVGTNIAGAWRFSATLPTQSGYNFQSQPQQQLAPGESIDYVLGFDQANRGSSLMISVNANFDHAITESNPDNNSATAYLTILGS